MGYRPTMNQGEDSLKKNIETHVLDQNLSMYGETLKVEFVEFIRPEIQFNSLEELRDQIKRDISNI